MDSSTRNELEVMRAHLDLVTARVGGLYKDAPPHPQDLVVVVEFNFTTPSPLILQSIAPGQVLSHVGVLIETPFNANASVTIGTPTELYLAADEVDTEVAGQYEHDVIRRFTTNDLLELKIILNGATAGSGLVLYKITA